MRQVRFTVGVLASSLLCACGPSRKATPAGSAESAVPIQYAVPRTYDYPPLVLPTQPDAGPSGFTDALANAESAGDSAAAPSVSSRTAGLFAKVPYRGVSMAGAEFAATTGGTFNGNALGTIPGDYYYPNKDWPNEETYPGGYGKNAFPYFRGKGMNTFRLPFRWERLQRSLNADFDRNEFARLKQTVADMEASGAYVLLDAHNYMRYGTAAKIAIGDWADTIGSKAVPYSAFADFWRRLAVTYKDDPKILFGLMNEPMGIDDLDQWLHAANAAVAAIRSTGAKNLILICGNEWADAKRWPDVSDMLKNIKDPANNFAFEVHVYPDAEGNGSGNACPDRYAATKQLEVFAKWARAHKARGFLGEFSAGTGIDAEANCMTALDEELSYLEKNSDVFIGWAYWAAGQGLGTDNPMEWSLVHKQNSKQMEVLVKHLQPSP